MKKGYYVAFINYLAGHETHKDFMFLPANSDKEAKKLVNGMKKCVDHIKEEYECTAYIVEITKDDGYHNILYEKQFTHNKCTYWKKLYKCMADFLEQFSD